MSSYIRHDAPIECFCPSFCCVFYGFRRCCTGPPLGINFARLGLEFCWGSAVSQACLRDAFIGHVHLPCAYVPLAVRHAPILCTLLLCFFGFRRCCTAPPLGINLARLGLELCWGSAVSQACLTDAFIGHVHLLRAYMICPAIRHAPIYMSMLFAAFLRVSTMLYGTASGDQFGTPWARILLGFRCFASMPHGCVQRLCRPIRADMSSYPPCAHLSMLLSILLAVFFTGFEDAVRHRLWGSIWQRLGLEFCWGSAVSQACLTDAFIGYVRLYAPICPSISAMMRLYNAFVHAFVLCFLRVSQMRYGTAAGDQFGTPWARILLGFHCFASMPHGCVHRPCPPVMHLQISKVRIKWGDVRKGLGRAKCFKTEYV